MNLLMLNPRPVYIIVYNVPVLVMVVFVGLTGKNVSDLSFQFCSLEH